MNITNTRTAKVKLGEFATEDGMTGEILYADRHIQVIQDQGEARSIPLADIVNGPDKAAEIGGRKLDRKNVDWIKPLKRKS